jgi:hypothetical protein
MIDLLKVTQLSCIDPYGYPSSQLRISQNRALGGLTGAAATKRKEGGGKWRVGEGWEFCSRLLSFLTNYLHIPTAKHTLGAQ